MDDQTLDGPLQDLLSQQMVLVQRVLAFNQEITRRLAEQGSVDMTGMVTVPPAARPRPPPRAPASPPPPLADVVRELPKAFENSPDGKHVEPLSPPPLSPPMPHTVPVKDGDLHEPLLEKSGTQRMSATSAKKALPVVEALKSAVDKKKNRKDRKSAGADQNKDGEMPAGVLPNPDEMKRKLLSSLNKPQYNVEDFYTKEGIWSDIARNENFQNAALVVILLNTVWIAIDTDYNKATLLCDAPPLFQIVNNLFCFAFVGELTIRFLAFKNKANCLQDSWFIFDGILVFLMAWETWIEVALFLLLGFSTGGGGAASVLRIFRMLRLTRVARLARLMRQMPELLILIKGMYYACKSVFATLLLLMIIIYIFAILFVQQLAGTDAGAGCFDDVPQAMNCLLMQGVFPEGREFIEKMLEIHWIFWVVTILFLLLSSLTVLNMLIGVLCEVISVTAKVEQEQITMQALKNKLTSLMPQMNQGTEGGLTVSKERFKELFDNEEAVQALHQVEVDIEALVDFADFIFGDKEELPLSDFMEKILRFRGSNNATVKDVVDLRMFVKTEISDLLKHLPAYGDHATHNMEYHRMITDN